MSPDPSKPNGDQHATLEQLKLQLLELADDVLFYLTAKRDRLKVAAFEKAIQLAWGAVGLLVLISCIAVSVTLVVLGIAGGVAELFRSHPWLGNLITGMVFLLVMFAALVSIINRLKRQAKERTFKRYEQHKLRQHARFGHTIAGRASTGD